MIYELCSSSDEKCSTEEGMLEVDEILKTVTVENLSFNNGEVCKYNLEFTWKKRFMYKE